jgi:hypothetical protein
MMIPVVHGTPLSKERTIALYNALRPGEPWTDWSARLRQRPEELGLVREQQEEDRRVRRVVEEFLRTAKELLALGDEIIEFRSAEAHAEATS